VADIEGAFAIIPRSVVSSFICDGYRTQCEKTQNQCEEQTTETPKGKRHTE
jgi:hypothetical protein